VVGVGCHSHNCADVYFTEDGVKSVLSIEQTTSQPIKSNTASTLKGIFIATGIIGIWAISLTLLLLLNISKTHLFFVLAGIFWQTFLYTGLFITAHDAMHGVVFLGNSKINHLFGFVCTTAYGCLPYKELLKKHWLHHHHPASESDPDFHDGKNKNFLSWYFHFMKSYWSWGQMIYLTIIYNFAHFILHIPRGNLNYFWALPAILSSLQLFYFGTFLTHREPKEGYSQPHRAKTISCPAWLSFIICYHFGYHEEHHEYPHVAWWQLPSVYRNAKKHKAFASSH
jgi:beta-carotene ketolase (CrtW type)